MERAGVEPVVHAASLAVAGLAEVVTHIPRIWLEYNKLLRAVRERRPELAILTDSPDFHLRLARKLKRAGIPVVYLVAPQVWAWRKGRVGLIRRTVDRLLAIFPFEPDFFRPHGIDAVYIGHPLTRLVKPSASRKELRERFDGLAGAPLVALLPGSRAGEIARHLPYLLKAVPEIRAAHPQARFLLGLPAGFRLSSTLQTFQEPLASASIQVVEGQTWDILASADLALAASGTVTVEAAILGAPLVTFYRVSPLSWLAGRLLVRVPFFSMVNLIAGRKVVPELMQSEMNRIGTEAARLLSSPEELGRMRRELGEVAEMLRAPEDPMEIAAAVVEGLLERERMHA